MIFDNDSKTVIEFPTMIIVMIRETKEVPNNVYAYDLEGNLKWRINDIIQAKVARGFDEIKKISDTQLRAYCELGIVYDIDIEKMEIISKEFIR